MAGNLVTDWLCIGTSGPTADGREILVEMVADAAETYSESFYSALIWPEHERYINYGLVKEVKLEKEGDVYQLFAKVAPNDWYRYSNDYGQRLFFSMELTPDFAGSGKWYLSGLGATDSPASIGTSQAKFSKTANANTVVFSAPIQGAITVGEDNANKHKNIFAKLFGGNRPAEEPTEVDKAFLSTLKDISAQVAELKRQFASKAPGDTDKAEQDQAELFKKFQQFMQEQGEKSKGSPTQTPEPEDFTKLAETVGKLQERFSAVQGIGEQLTALEKNLKDLTEEFKKAVGEEKSGTNPDENTGENLNVKSYL